MYTLILVDYNSMDCAMAFLQQCADKLTGQDCLKAVLVDNGTESENLAALRSRFSECETLPQQIDGRPVYRLSDEKTVLLYHRSGANLGFARGNNLGARIADLYFDTPYYLFSNNDIILPQSIDLQEVTRRFEADPQMGLLGPRVVGTDDVPQTPRKRQSAFKKLIAWYWGVGPMRKHVDDIDYNAEPGPCEWVTGCFFFMRRAALAAAGGFDEHTFLYAEEMIISARLRNKGFTTVYDPVYTIIHDHRDAYKTVPQALRTIKISFDSNSYYYKTYRGTSPVLILLARCSFALYRLLYPLWQKTKKS